MGYPMYDIARAMTQNGEDFGSGFAPQNTYQEEFFLGRADGTR